MNFTYDTRQQANGGGGMGVTSVATGTGLTGGTITTTGTISLAPVNAGFLLANLTGSSAAPLPHSMSAILDYEFDNVEGGLIFRASTQWNFLAAGVAGQVLTTGGPGADPYWASANFNPDNTIYFAIGGDDGNPGTEDFPLLTLGQAVTNAQALIVGGATYVFIIGRGVGIDTSNVSVTESGLNIYAPGFQHDPVSGDAFTVDLSGGLSPSYFSCFLNSSAVTSGAKVVNLVGATAGIGGVTNFYYLGITDGDVYLNVPCNFASAIITGVLTANQPGTNVVVQQGIASQTQQTRLNLEGVLYGAAGSSFHGPVACTNAWRYPMRQIVQLSGDRTLSAGDSGFLFVNSTTNPYTVTLPDTTGQGTPPFVIGFEATFLNLSTGSISFVAGGVSTLIGSSIINGIAQRENCTLTAANTWEVDNVADSAPDGINYYFSKLIGSDTTGTGSETNPFASIGFTYAASGSPIHRVFIKSLDGEAYDEQLVLDNSNKFITASFANLQYSGEGDAITIIAAGAGIPIQLSTISAADGYAVNNTSSEIVVLETGALLQGDVLNSGSGLINVNAKIVGVNFTNTGAGNIYYNIDVRVGGTDSAGVIGVNILGTSSTWTAQSDITSVGGNISANSGFLFAQGNITSNSGNILANTGFIQATEGNIIAGTNGASGQFISYSASANTGNLITRATANTANVTTEITNQPTSVGTTHALPNVAISNATILVNALTQVDPSANIIYFDTTVTFDQLAGGASVPLVSTFFGGQYRVRDLKLVYNSLNLLGGDRDINITDGTSVYSTIPSASLITSSNSTWGSVSMPFDSVTPLNTLTQPGLDLSAIYTGGTTDYVSGEVTISGCWEKVV